MLLCKPMQLGFPVKGSIVHHNHGSLWKRREQLMFEPILKHDMVHGAPITAWRDDFVSQHRRYNADTRIPASPDQAVYQLPSGGIAVRPV